jgi:hypothetical protein
MNSAIPVSLHFYDEARQEYRETFRTRSGSQALAFRMMDLRYTQHRVREQSTAHRQTAKSQQSRRPLHVIVQIHR